MLKRILALTMSVFVIFSVVAAVPVSATEIPANLATDYVADVSTRYSNNMITAGADGLVGNAWSGNYTYGYNGKGSLVTAAYSDRYAFMKPTVNITTGFDGGTDPVAGFIVNTTKPAGLSGRVVWSFSFKADNSNTMFVNVGRRNGSVASGSAAYLEYPIEYDGSDKGIAPTLGYVAHTGTFADTGASPDKYTYEIGFVVGTVAQAPARIDSTLSYIGYEYAYDIEVSAESTHLAYGEKISVDADILNQIGNEYGGSQDVTWYALNQSRTNLVQGFTIVNGDNGSASVSADGTVFSGTYALVAVSNVDNKFVKGIEITVSGRDLSDCVPGDVTGNKALITDQNGGALVSSNYRPFDIVVGTANAGTSEEAWTLETIEDTPAEGIIGANGMGAAGVSFNKSCYGASELLKAGKNIVIGAKVRATRGTPTVQASMYQYGIEPTFPVEYPDGMKIKGSEWQNFTATLHIPETGWKGANNTHFYFGYAYTGLVDECERVVAIKKDSVYIGEEYAYDMQVTASSKICAVGKTTYLTVDATVLNQIGSTGYLDQDVSWYALNDERTSYADGITIIENSDGSATVSVANTVPAGTYDIVAASDTYDGIQKGISIKVKNPYEDYVPGDAMEGNFIEDTTGEVLFPTWIPNDVTSIGTTSSGTDDEAWTVASYKNVESSVLEMNASGVGGAGISADAYNAAQNLSAGKKIVIGAKVKATTGTPIIKTSMYHLQSTPIFPAEYPQASEGFTVSGSQWQDFGATLQIPESGWRGYEHTIFYLGFVYTGKIWDGPRGFAVKKNSFYMGEERAYDIKVTADSTKWTEGETTAITLDATVVNQVGTEGYLNQNVTWHALDATRSFEVPGINVQENSDGTATVTVAETIPSGVYDIVAVSDAYEDFVRGVRITVVADEEAVERVAVFNLTENNGVAMLSAAVADTGATEIFFAIASYDENNKMIKSEVLPVTVVDGVATVSGLSIDEIVDGMKIRGFVWENLTWRPIKFAEGIENTVIIKEKEGN